MTLKAPTKQQLSLAALSVAANLTYFVLPLIIGALVNTRDLSDAQSGFLATSQILTTASLTCALFPFVHKIPAKPALYLGLAMLAIGNLATLVTHDMVGLVPIRVFTGVGEALANVVVSILIGQQDDVERGFAIQAFGIGAGSALVSLAAPMLAPIVGDAAIFVVLGLVPLATMLLVPGSPDALPPTATLHSTQHSSLRLLQRPVVLLMLVSFLLMVVATNATFAFFERSAEHIGMSFNQVVYVLSLSAIPTLAGPLIAHVMGLRFGRLAPLLVSYFAIGFGALMIGFGSTPAVLVSGLVLQNAAVMLAYPYMRGLAAVVDPAGRVLTLTLSIFIFGIGVTPAIAALVLTAGYGFHGLSALSAVLIVMASVTILPMAGQSRRNPQTPVGVGVGKDALVP